MEIKGWLIIIGFVCLVALVIFADVIEFPGAKRRRLQQEQKEEDEYVQREKDSAEHWIRRNLSDWFGMTPDDVHNTASQEEIVRIVNLEASRVSQLCHNQTQMLLGGRGLNGGDDAEVSQAKGRWAEKRNLTIELVPELAGRMPHFSEFEPLKSYHEERIAQKRQAMR
jgi:hypothetical protein